MKIAVLSGKGGAGKTFVASNLVNVMDDAVYVDCDVEEPNGHLFFKPTITQEISIYKSLPSFDAKKCNGCRACVDFCQFNALLYLVNRPILFPEVCHSCKGCMLVCKEQAISEIQKEIGVVKIGVGQAKQIITGILNPGEVSGIPIIKEAIRQAETVAKTIVLDCPPGSACSVMETIEDANYCILVVEPTAFGFHNFQMVYELTTLLHKKCGVVINKEERCYEPLEHFCQEHQIKILKRIPYQKKTAKQSADGCLVTSTDEDMNILFKDLYHCIEENAL